MLFLISVERYIYIHHPLKYSRIFSVKKAVILTTTCWAIVLVLGTSSILVKAKTPQGPVCLYNNVFDTRVLVRNSVTYYILFTLPMIYIYSKIAHTAKKLSIAEVVPNGADEAARSLKKTNIKLAKMIALILGLYLSTYACMFAFYTKVNYDSAYSIKLFYYTLAFFYRANTWVNTVIYGYMNKPFRKAFVTLLHLEKYFSSVVNDGPGTL